MNKKVTFNQPIMSLEAQLIKDILHQAKVGRSGQEPMGVRALSPKLLPFVYQLRYRYFRFKIPLRSNDMKSYLRYTVQKM